MTRRTAKVHQPAFSQQDDSLAIAEDDVVHLRLDVFPGLVAQAGDIDFIVEVPDVADDGLILHPLHVVIGDHVVVARRRDEDIGLVGGVLHGDHAIAFHRRLQGADRIDLGDPDGRTQTAQ